MPLDTIMRVAKNTMEAFLKGPPKLYNPQYLTNANWIKLFSEDMRKHGLGYAYNNSRMQSTRRKGTYVGSDYNGNKYYEDRSAPYNRSRWVEYPVVQGVWAIEMRYDGSMVRRTQMFDRQIGRCPPAHAPSSAASSALSLRPLQPSRFFCSRCLLPRAGEP